MYSWFFLSRLVLTSETYLGLEFTSELKFWVKHVVHQKRANIKKRKHCFLVNREFRIKSV